ncbi:MAG: glycosyltransferase [Candidatus Kapaibacterium sp.]|nr:MAG: glycosyltransferase [Candidatus Kapabacteria bacterium]
MNTTLMNTIIPFDIPTMLVVAALAAWSIFFVIVAINGLSVQLLRDVPLLVAKEQLPSLSVIAAACNEAETIEKALYSLLSTEYPRVEFLIVNDRSSDETGAIIDRIAAIDNRIKPIHITTLPDGWLGKVHALHVASQQASGDFLLFTDADIHFAPNALTLALGYAEHHRLDHFVVLPETRKPSLSSAVQQWLVSIAIAGFTSLFLFSLRLYSLRKPQSEAFIGVGAFNLVRKSAFLKTPGFEWLKMEVIDDLGLGMMMKRSGARCDAVNGVGLVHLEWYATLGAVAQGFEKNFFAGFGQYSTPVMLWRITQIAAMVYSPYFAALWAWFVQGEMSLAYAILCVHFILPVIAAFILQKRLPFHPFFFGTLPVSFFLVIGMMLRSAWKTVRNGGILWRGTFYPLETLRREQRMKL